MRVKFVVASLFISCLIPSFIAAQESDAQKRTKELLAPLNEKKHLTVEKNGVSKERYKEIRSDAVVKKNLQEYSGRYEVPDIGYTLDIRITDGGKIEAGGYEPKNGNTQQVRRFRLENTNIQGALLTASKLYDDGTTEKFEGVFINRMVREGSSPSQAKYTDIAFGLGVVGVQMKAGDQISTNKLFYYFKP